MDTRINDLQSFEECQKLLEEMKGDKGFSLECLFDIWEKAQSLDASYDEYKAGSKKDAGNLMCNHVAKDSFVYDGNLYDEGRPETKVLYILREADICHGKKDEDKPVRETCKYFWFKNGVVEDERENVLGRHIGSKLHKMQTAINGHIGTTKKEHFKNAAYMNINKRGGLAEVNWDNLKNYISLYKNFIIAEIEMLSPDVIVSCVPEDYIHDILQEATKNKKAIIVYMGHPTRASNEKYIAEFKEKLANAKSK